MAQGGMTLETQFVHFSKFGDTKSDGKTITLTQIDKWLKQAHVIDKKITTTDTGISFNKFKSKTIGLGDFNKFIDDLGNQKGIPPAELKTKLIECGLPGTTKTTATAHVGGVDRLTDTTQYTGTHKERFDAEGKGKGKEGRENVVANDGYVADYKGKDTYDKK